MVRFDPKAKLDQIVDDMIAIKDPKEAEAYFADYAEHLYRKESSQTKEEATGIASRNLGYLSGYAPTRIDCAMWNKIGAIHPILGNSLEGMSESSQKGNKNG